MKTIHLWDRCPLLSLHTLVPELQVLSTPGCIIVHCEWKSEGVRRVFPHNLTPRNEHNLIAHSMQQPISRSKDKQFCTGRGDSLNSHSGSGNVIKFDDRWPCSVVKSMVVQVNLICLIHLSHLFFFFFLLQQQKHACYSTLGPCFQRPTVKADPRLSLSETVGVCVHKERISSLKAQIMKGLTAKKKGPPPYIPAPNQSVNESHLRRQSPGSECVTVRGSRSEMKWCPSKKEEKMN